MHTVLIVEDEMLISIGIQNMIAWSELDMVVVGDARNGKEGLELYYQERPDVILTDIKMPIMDGLEMIREIRKQDKETRIIVLSCYEEYGLVRDAFKIGISDYILKLEMFPEDMNNVIQKVKQELLDADIGGKKEKNSERSTWTHKDIESICRDFIFYQGSTYQEFKNVMDAMSIKENQLTVCIMEGDSYQDKQDIETERRIVVNLIQELLSENDRGVVFEEQSNRYLLLLSFAETESGAERKTKLERLLQRIQHVIENYIGSRMVFGISHFDDSYMNLHKMYQEALKAVQWSFLLQEDITCYGSRTAMRKLEKMLIQFEEKVSQDNRLTDNCKDEILQKISILKSIQEPELGVIKETFRHLIYRVSFDVRHYDAILKMVFDSTEKIRLASSLDELIRIFENLIEMMPKDQEYMSVNGEVKQAIIYIREHYNETDISLLKVAGVVGLNKEYFSSLFKKNTGMGFSEYVNKIRMNKACELLKTTTLRTYEVAQRVGVQDESYFSRVFKKIVGMRPNDYRKHEIESGEFLPEE